MTKRRSFHAQNYPQLIALCDELGLEYEILDEFKQHIRIMGVTHVIDIWPARMVHHRVNGETIRSHEPWPRSLDQRFNKQQVTKLLTEGKL